MTATYDAHGSFTGHTPRECGEHRTLGHRAWCLDCGEYCTPTAPCARCEIVPLRVERDNLQAELEAGRHEAKPGVEDFLLHYTIDDDGVHLQCPVCRKDVIADFGLTIGRATEVARTHQESCGVEAAAAEPERPGIMDLHPDELL